MHEQPSLADQTVRALLRGSDFARSLRLAELYYFHWITAILATAVFVVTVTVLSRWLPLSVESTKTRGQIALGIALVIAALGWLALRRLPRGRLLQSLCTRFVAGVNDRRVETLSTSASHAMLDSYLRSDYASWYHRDLAEKVYVAVRLARRSRQEIP